MWVDQTAYCIAAVDGKSEVEIEKLIRIKNTPLFLSKLRYNVHTHTYTQISL